MANRIQPGFTTAAQLTQSVGTRGFMGLWEERDLDRNTLPEIQGATLQARSDVEDLFAFNNFRIIWRVPSGTAQEVLDRTASLFLGLPVVFTARGITTIQFCTGATAGSTAITFTFGALTGHAANPYNHPTGTFMDDVTEFYSVWMWDRVDSDGVSQASEPSGLVAPNTEVNIAPTTMTTTTNIAVEIESRQHFSTIFDTDGTTILSPARESLVAFVPRGFGAAVNVDDSEFINTARLIINGNEYNIGTFSVLERGGILVEAVR